MPSQNLLRIGVFIPNGAQLLDVSPIDLFGMLSPDYLAACKLPAPLISLGTPSSIHYIGLSSSAGKAELTANLSINLTKTTKDVEVQPGKLDIILIPGPDPSLVFGEEALNFLRVHSAWTGTKGQKTDILSVCTGCILVAQSGIIKYRKSSAPRGLVSMLREKYPATTWVEDKRWVVDGNIWSSGGITNGQEMVAAYLREKYPGPATEAVLAMADCGEKGIEYGNSSTVNSAWWIWQILRAFLWNKVKKA